MTSQGEMMAQRVEELVKSERQFVMNCIKVQNLPLPERVRATRNYIINCSNATPSIWSDPIMACILSNENV